MHDADQSEQAPCGLMIDVDFSLETVAQQLRALIVQGLAPGIDDLEFVAVSQTVRLEIAFADRAIVADRPA